MNKPKATVIINTVNEHPERLALAIDSYKKQHGVKLQIIISTIENDISINMGNQMGCEVIISKQKGIYEQLNNAINYIKGDWWCYASGHDLAFPNKIIDEINCCIENNKLICYSAFTLVNPETNEKKPTYFYDYDYEQHLTRGNFVNDCAIINTELTKKYIPFQSDKWGNDSFYDFWLRVYEGEKNVFHYNNEPTWYYIAFNDSKHIVRQKSEAELNEYKQIRINMLNSHREEKPLITIGLPTYQSKIVWLAMESLCRQNTNIKWELIICEDKVGGHGENYFKKYENRLKKVGCINLKYIEVIREDNISNRLALSLKWRIIAQAAHNSSLAMLLQASDCYSEPNRIETAYNAFKNGYDWINSRFGIFYHIYLKKSILFDMLAINTPVGLNMGISMKIAKQLPKEIKYSSVDNWLYTSMLNIKPEAKSYLDTSDNWQFGVDTDGENIISKKRSEQYETTRPPFSKTDLNVLDNMPKEVVYKLTNGNIIEQCYVCESIKFFEPKIFDKFKFINRRADNTNAFIIDKNKPLLMFGCYGPGDFNKALNHNSQVVIIWAGSDSMGHNTENIKQFIGRNNIFHISGSKFISDDLDKIGLKYEYIPISLCDHSEIKSEKLGDKIYIYTSSRHPEFYGKLIYDQLIKHYGEDKFIICNSNSYSKSELYELYTKCFIGLRLVHHDGLSETVAELGLMGRNVIYNGDTPNSLQYTDVESIIKLIDKEAKKIGTEQKELSIKMRDYLNVGVDWLDVEYFLNKLPLINILVRTHKRPEYFRKCITSIKNQTYNKINIIVGVEEDDNETLDYVKEYDVNIIRYKKETKTMPVPEFSDEYGDWFPYNEYLNKLTQSVESGYILYLDDDDYFLNNNAISEIVDKIKTENDLITWRVQFPLDRIIPSNNNFKSLEKGILPYADVSGIGFLYHSKHKNIIDWGKFKLGDYRVYKKLYYICNKIFINEILTGVQNGVHKGQTEKEINKIETINETQTFMKVIIIDSAIGKRGETLDLEITTAQRLIDKGMVKEFTDELKEKVDANILKAKEAEKAILINEENLEEKEINNLKMKIEELVKENAKLKEKLNSIFKKEEKNNSETKEFKENTETKEVKLKEVKTTLRGRPKN